MWGPARSCWTAEGNRGGWARCLPLECYHLPLWTGRQMNHLPHKCTQSAIHNHHHAMSVLAACPPYYPYAHTIGSRYDDLSHGHGVLHSVVCSFCELHGDPLSQSTRTQSPSPLLISGGLTWSSSQAKKHNTCQTYQYYWLVVVDAGTLDQDC